MQRLAPILITVVFLLFSCKSKILSENYKLVFSDDTVYFDTVFATIGSATRELRVRNPEKNIVLIEKIDLSGGANSQFRMNIDGEPGYSRENVEIEPGDSIFIFIEVNVDPSGQNSPLAVTDSINFRTGNSIQKVQLLAWGQDINLIKNKVIGTTTWNKDKPFLIYNNVFIDTLSTLTIDKGSRIYFHRNSIMTVAGTIVVNGTNDSPVLFAGDRLEKMYKDIPGQWLGIDILNISSGNSIDHAVIRNTVSGIKIGDPINSSNIPDLKILNTSVSHSTITCLSAVNSSIVAANCIFSHSGKNCINIYGSGNYQFTSCTIFDQWDYGFRLTPSLFVSEKQNSGKKSAQMLFRLNNSVVYGDLNSEMEIEPSGMTFTGNYLIDHCLLKLDTLHSTFWSGEIFPDAIINKNPLFIDVLSYDYRPDTLSPLIDKGNPLYTIDFPFDIRGESRTKDGKPDIGAFERITGEH